MCIKVLLLLGKKEFAICFGFCCKVTFFVNGLHRWRCYPHIGFIMHLISSTNTDLGPFLPRCPLRAAPQSLSMYADARVPSPGPSGIGIIKARLSTEEMWARTSPSFVMTTLSNSRLTEGDKNKPYRLEKIEVMLLTRGSTRPCQCRLSWVACMCHTIMQYGTNGTIITEHKWVNTSFHLYLKSKVSDVTNPRHNHVRDIGWRLNKNRPNPNQSTGLLSRGGLIPRVQDPSRTSLPERECNRAEIVPWLMTSVYLYLESTTWPCREPRVCMVDEAHCDGCGAPSPSHSRARKHKSRPIRVMPMWNY